MDRFGLVRGHLRFVSDVPVATPMSVSHPGLTAPMEVARRIMKERHTVLRDLASSGRGDGSGLRDPGLPESGLARPRNVSGGGDAEKIGFAAIQALGMARTHPFIDGHSLTATLARAVVLALPPCALP